MRKTVLESAPHKKEAKLQTRLTAGSVTGAAWREGLHEKLYFVQSLSAALLPDRS